VAPLFVAVGGRKGGVGKTSTMLAMASAMLDAGRRVLVVDLDPQGSATVALNAAANGGAEQVLAHGDLAGVQDLGNNLLLLAGGAELGYILLPPECWLSFLRPF
jgi:cellulose biosynthesis protein BcsQ